MQPLLIEYTKDEIIEKLREALEKRGEHSLYCCWVKDGGYYDRKLGCTCGLQDALELTNRGGDVK